MKSAALHAALIACLLILPAGTAGVSGAAPQGLVGLPGGPGGENPGGPGRPLLFPNISFTGRAPAAHDWYARGFALTGKERYAEAAAAYEQALDADPSLLNAWYYLGDALFRLGRYRESLLALENATRIDPDFVDAYFSEAVVYRQLGLPEEEKAALGRGLEAAERKNAGREGASPGSAPGPFPLAASPVSAVLGAGIALLFLARPRQ